MNRKHFLKNFVGSAAAIAAAPGAFAATDPVSPKNIAQPPFLQPGDIIGITCPASPMELKEMVNCQKALNEWGFKVCVGNTVGQVWERFGGSDAERSADLQLMLNDPSIKAILFARGGYGAMRMMDVIDWSAFEKNPKWLVGYSDLTAIHCHVQSLMGIPTIHGDMVNGFKSEADISTASLQKVLTGSRIEYTGPYHSMNRMGQSSGLLVGGNLSLVAAMLGSKSELQTAGKILLLEEVSEYKYTIDRMMISLKRSGMLDNLAGLVIGGLTATRPDNELTFPMSVEEIILEKVRDRSFPVCFNFPAGHLKNNKALKLGIHYNLYVTQAGSSLNEVSDPHPEIPTKVIPTTI